MSADRAIQHQFNIVPFNFFARLIETFSKVKPEPAVRRSSSSSSGSSLQHLDVLESWIARLHRPFLRDTGAIFFRLLFPEEDKDRKYNMQESKLCRILADIFVVDSAPGKRGYRLATWKDSAEGCLGREVQYLLEETYGGPEHPTSPTFQEVDALLDELASTSQWSNVSSRPLPEHKRPVKQIVADLYRDLTPFGAGVMTQIILKDVRPLVYTQPLASMSSSLLSFNSKAYQEITPHLAMRAWHPDMSKIYRTNSKLDSAALAVEQLQLSEVSVASLKSLDAPGPTVGIPVEIPKCVKGHSCQYALRRLSGASRTYAETKYDGERMQIHVDFSRLEGSQIRIFSKSKRDSTEDRIATHSIIRAAFGIPPESDAHEKLIERTHQAHPRECTVQSAILEAEMVPYSELTGDIEKFWRIRGLIGATAHGIRRKERRNRKSDVHSSDSEDETKVDFMETQDSLASDGTAKDTRHFMLVFFDVLLLNGQSLLKRPYEHRRLVLKEIIIPIPGFSRVARAHMVPTEGANGSTAAELLQRHFRQETADNKEEGIILKAGDSFYNDFRKPWVKIKRDYIKGYGDTLDFVIVGAGWNKERGRELRVGPSVNTTLYVGCVSNMAEVKLRRSVRPHFEVYFTVEYGLSRAQLEDLNTQMLCWGPVSFQPTAMQGMPYTFNLRKTLEPPRSMFSRPILVELMGDRFTKAAGAPGYELRFPRITKVWRREERNWTEGVSLQELRNIATEALHRAPEVIARTVNVPTSPAIPKDIAGKNRKRAWPLSELSVPIKRVRSITNLPISRTAAHEANTAASTESLLPDKHDRVAPCTLPASHIRTSPRCAHGNRENQPSLELMGRLHRRHSPTSAAAQARTTLSGLLPPSLITDVSGYSSPPSADPTVITPSDENGHLNLFRSIFADRPGSPCENQTAHLEARTLCSNPVEIINILQTSFSSQDAVSAQEETILHSLSIDPYTSPRLEDAAIWIDDTPPLHCAKDMENLSPASLFATLDAFLIAAGWCPNRRLPVPQHLHRGLIFINQPRADTLIDTLITMQQTLEKRKEDVRLRISVCAVEELEGCMRSLEHVLQPMWVSA